MITDQIAVVDTDSHLSEPPDLWLSRLPSKWREVAPQIRYFPQQGEEYWFIGGRPTYPAWGHSQANWLESPPSHPRVLAEVDVSTYDPVERAKAMQASGIAVQVLYPNVVGFQLHEIIGVGDADFAVACLRAYNDYVVEFAGRAPNRFVPIMALPFWDLDAALTELERGAAMGHKGVVFANRPEVLGAAPLVDPHWDPLWARAEEAGLSINFHIGFGTGFGDKQLAQPAGPGALDAISSALPSPPVDELPFGKMSKQVLEFGDEWVADYRLDLVRIGNRSLLSNATALIDIILAGICDRFENLDFVSVESGWGYFPFVLESADWNWAACGASSSWPKRLLPSEYFRRQCYATFWFESETVTRTVDLYADNVMFETDFPHPVALMPGAGPNIMAPNETIEANLGRLPYDVLEKILSTNARRVYHLPAG